MYATTLTLLNDQYGRITRPSYVTDLDCWSFLAIVSTAPKLQAQYLRDFMYKHISFKTFIGVQLPVSHCHVLHFGSELIIL